MQFLMAILMATVSVQVWNGSRDAAVKGVRVTLYAFPPQGTPQAVDSAVTDARGKVRFDVDPAKTFYAAAVQYHGEPYGAPLQGETLTLQVFDTLSSAKKLGALTYTALVADMDTAGVLLLEAYGVQQDTPYVLPRGAFTFRVSQPEGATFAGANPPDGWAVEEKQLVFHQPLRPGMNQTMVQFAFPAKTRKFEVPVSLPRVPDTVRVVFPEGYSISGVRYTLKEPQTIQGRTFQLAELFPGEATFLFRVSAGGGWAFPVSPLAAAVGGGILLLVLLGLFWKARGSRAGDTA